MTRRDTGLASRTRIEIHGEGVLLAGSRLRLRNKVAVVASLGRHTPTIVPLGETLDGCHPLLLRQQIVDYRTWSSFVESGHSSLLKIAWSSFRSCRVVND
jgi:hypothetical protein